MNKKRFIQILPAAGVAACSFALWVGVGCAAWFERHVADAAVVQERIAGLDVPDDFHPAYGLDLGSSRIAGFDGADQRSHLVLAEAPLSIGATAPMPWVTRPNTDDLNVIALRSTVARGRPATIAIALGVSNDGLAYRVVSLAFEGRNGPALLVLNTPESEWDEAAVDALIGSLR
ncbi:MAG TPA: hypothetical protein PK954_12135 [Anaerolineales bacterium]|nr:hypothetical protein [Anaerolineales bacterium]